MSPNSLTNTPKADDATTIVSVSINQEAAAGERESESESEMGEDAAEGNATAAVRIHVGGLGESVTSDDLRKIFSAMGSVHGVDFVRTKGRCFAYIHFSPSSPNSLSKLFSTYNGCVWKGGRLRFEKAKEHYLARLRREWEEVSALANTSQGDRVDVDNNIYLSAKPTKPTTSDKKQLNIFFPRLRKVKSVPFSGTGKHKYSFQRVEVPSLPAYFCDCEEHFMPHTPQVKHMHDLELYYGGINDQELSVMNSVMNRLFQRESHSKSEHSKSELENEEDKNIKLIVNPENEADFEEDDDNLVINVVSNVYSILPSSKKWVQETVSRKRKSVLDKTPMNGDCACDGQRKNDIYPNKKRKSIICEGSGRKESTPAEPESRESSRTDTDASRTKAVLGTLPSQPGVKHLNGSFSWSQKSSWKALIADRQNSTFSVSNVLPGTVSKEKQPTSNVVGIPNSSGNHQELAGYRKLEEHARDLPTQANTILNKSLYPDFIDEPNKNAVKEQKRERSPTMKTRKSLVINERNASTAAYPIGGGKSQMHAKGSELGTKQSMTNHSFQESSSKVLVGVWGSSVDVSSQIASTAYAQEDQSRPDNANLEKDKNSENENFAMKQNLDNKLTKRDIGERLMEAQSVKQDGSSNRSRRGSSWLQKSSWTQLVSEENSAFSITQLFPGFTPEKNELTGPKSEDAENTTYVKRTEAVKLSKYKSSGDGSPTDEITGDSVIQSLPEMSQQNVVGNDGTLTPVVHEQCDTAMKKTFRGNTKIGETCSFMRNATSLKEWANAKKALSVAKKKEDNGN